MELVSKTYRISGEGKGFFTVLDTEGSSFRAELKGRFYHETEYFWPSVGDWVHGTIQPGGWVSIEETVQRKNQLQRLDPVGKPQVFASNVDYMFVVTSANQDLSNNRLDRFITMAVANAIAPVIIINKIDLCDDVDRLLQSVRERHPGCPVHGVSASDKVNKEIFLSLITDSITAVFVGTSGVGKSTLVNWLLNEAKQETTEIREDDSRGRHTTTSRSLHTLVSGGFVIDTPGIRTLGLVDAEEGVRDAFADVSEWVSQCRFSNCQHISEPGCAIKKALETKILSPERWAGFRKLLLEQQFQAEKLDPQSRSEKKEKYKQINKALKQIKNEKKTW